MRKKYLRIGITSPEAFQARMMAIAKGEIEPKHDEPKVFFQSFHSAAQVLSGQNQELLKVILEEKPGSLKELAELSGRKESSLSRTLKTMEKYGIVTLKKENRHIMPVVNATDFRVEFGLY